MAATRPGSVTFVAVLTYINGILNIIGGVVLLFTRESAPGADTEGGLAGITTSAIVSIVLGIVILIVARGLLGGSKVSRALVTLVMILNLVNGVLLLFTLQFFSGVLEILWVVIVLSLLFTRRANAFFNAGSSA
ncbi:hypothetical protein IT072_07225 [Leifsonia sp. ZF2019]|uniref:DUF7144 family membrane protein n=1 Tax=Leifsonia sp. ZF2019 TaxID=2781978 RepID=UPI001CC12FDC|nr:hypothetical protein [Leifsonia sp. ZF2019]UAJ80795.1 hypothetical protein IT072_07225 [Leifsonia sp. ZF2019]